MKSDIFKDGSRREKGLVFLSVGLRTDAHTDLDSQHDPEKEPEKH